MRAILASVAVLWMTAAIAAAQQPTIAEAQADFDKGQYRTSLQKIARLLSAPTAKANPTERYDLLMLRGENMLALKEAALAADAFETAARTVKTGDDVKRLGQARGMAILVRASPGLKYTRKGSDEPPIDIASRDSRTAAMNALLAERIVTVEPKVKSALEATSLLPIKDLMPALGEMYSLEIATAGESKVAVPLAQTLGEHARKLIETELTRIGSRIDELYAMASAPTLSSNPGAQTLSYRGLTSPERKELQDAADYLVNIEKVAQEGRRVNLRFGGTGDVWDRILGEIGDLKDAAQRVYDRRF